MHKCLRRLTKACASTYTRATATPIKNQSVSARRPPPSLPIPCSADAHSCSSQQRPRVVALGWATPSGEGDSAGSVWVASRHPPTPLCDLPYAFSPLLLHFRVKKASHFQRMWNLWVSISGFLFRGFLKRRMENYLKPEVLAQKL